MKTRMSVAAWARLLFLVAFAFMCVSIATADQTVDLRRPQIDGRLGKVWIENPNDLWVYPIWINPERNNAGVPTTSPDYWLRFNMTKDLIIPDVFNPPKFYAEAWVWVDDKWWVVTATRGLIEIETGLPGVGDSRGSYGCYGYDWCRGIRQDEFYDPVWYTQHYRRAAATVCPATVPPVTSKPVKQKLTVTDVEPTGQ